MKKNKLWDWMDECLGRFLHGGRDTYFPPQSGNGDWGLRAIRFRGIALGKNRQTGTKKEELWA